MSCLDKFDVVVARLISLGLEPKLLALKLSLIVFFCQAINVKEMVEYSWQNICVCSACYLRFLALSLLEDRSEIARVKLMKYARVEAIRSTFGV